MNRTVSRAVVLLASTAVATTGLAVLSTATHAAEVGENCHVVTTGTADWAMRTSFNSYLEGPIANGALYKYKGGIEVRDGVETSGERATRQFTWPVSGSNDGEINFGGGVHWTGHNHYTGDDASQAPDNFILDLDISNPTIEFNGTQATLLVDYKSREFVDTTTVAGFLSGTQAELATITLDEAIDLTTPSVTVIGETVPTAAGVDVMGGFYPAGDALAPITLNLTNEVVCDEPQEPETPETPDATTGSSEGGILGIVGILAALGGIGAVVYNYLVSAGIIAAY
ncbi:hypothetical protein CDES_02175 [Corynebacterium deserti GIMN1.010]|uniref:Htaa domain-containing protein n=1 Tax=Corynebacterium deserti GIMN1.010 TaxID=931089 RepID=A0A0M4CK44_9CORY|nr:HtaA domain-containing protein [Corynebacterium deserti]ALC04897.1 hypothetical protein CDES_02175 [Corynebacterium deserti GIMN1.010]